MLYGYPATTGGGFGSSIPVTSVGTSPFPGGFGKLPFGKFPFGKGYPASVSGGFGGALPVTSGGKAPFGI